MGIGNPLMGDEGVGVRVVELLMAGFTFPPNVDVVDAGTMGLTILDLLRDVDRLLVIDAVDGTGHDPGTVLLLDAEEIAPNTVMHSLHDTRLVDVLQAAELMGMHVEATCIGVQVRDMEQWVLDLSPAVADALPRAAAAALDVLSQWGVKATPREDADVDASILRALRTYERMPDPNDAR